MKKKIVFILIVLFLIKCGNHKEKTCRIGLPDRNYAFLNSIKPNHDFGYLYEISDIRELGLVSNYNWLRKPENLKLFYASIKTVGIENFISKNEFNKPLYTDNWAKTSWANKSLNQIVKNLISSYSDTTRVEKYYKEFWNRRKLENNESIVLKIFKDINITYNFNKSSEKLNWQSQPIITGLLEFELKLNQKDTLGLKEVKIDYYNFLKSLGLYSSANNFIRHENELIIGGDKNQIVII